VSDRRRRVTLLAGRTLVALGVVGAGGVAVIRYTGLQEYGFRMMGVAGASVPVVGGTAALALLGATLVLVARAAPLRHTLGLLVVAVLPVVLLVQMTAPALAGALFPERATGGEGFSVVAQNMFFQNDDPAGTLDAVLRRRADVVVLTEFTPRVEELLDARPDAAELDDRYPHQWRQAEAYGSGLAVLSSLPFDSVVRVPLSDPAIVARLRVGEERVDLYAVHPMAPSNRWGLLQWEHDYGILTADAEDAGPRTVMLGDFNATTGHGLFRHLLDAGDLRDAHDVGGGGLVGTWPVGWGILPQVMRLDHVLVGEGIGVERFAVLEPTGSDHRGIEAWLRVPRS
jgi:endonuclease/exonuclease/phosphatase (EEP) superfamily protein YafD